MSLNDKIDDDESKEFDDGYDENLLGDEEDKKKLAQMTEKEREQELFNRSERRETLKIRFEIERKLRSKAKKRDQEKKQVRAKKRLRASEIYSSDNSSDESDEYTPDIDLKSSHEHFNTSSSNKTTTKMNTRSALLSTSSSSDASSASSASSASPSSESEQENDDEDTDRKKSDGNEQAVQDDFQMTLADLRTLQLKRDRIEKWIYAPFFRDTAVGLFAKMSVGPNPTTKQPMYKVAQIKEITQGNKIYAINNNTNKTDKNCLVRIGRVERTYQMSFISNRTFDEDDYNRWKGQLEADGSDMPSREFFNRKKRDLHNAVNYNYEEKDIQNEVYERSRFMDHPYNFALKRLELIGEKSEAEARNDYETAERISKQIDELEEKARQLEKSRSSSTFSAISFVNERNRYKNIVESERVLKESKSVKTEDPFTRRKCTPTIVHNKNNNNGDILNNPLDKQQNDKNGQDVSKRNVNQNNGNSNNGSINNNGSNNGANKLNTVKSEGVKSVDDLFQAHASIDLELDIDI